MDTIIFCVDLAALWVGRVAVWFIIFIMFVLFVGWVINDLIEPLGCYIKEQWWRLTARCPDCGKHKR